MSRIIASVAVILLIKGMSSAKADMVLTIDPTSFVSNDVAPWVSTPFSQGGRYPTTNGLGIFSFGFTARSVPEFDTLGTTRNRTLFIGVSATPPPNFPQFPATAYYSATAHFEFGTTPVTGFGFYLLQASSGTQFRVFDVQNGFEDFTLSTPLSANYPFVSITSDVPIAGFQFSNSVTDSTAILHVSEVLINAAVPAPPAIVGAVMGLLVLGGYVRCQRKTPLQ
jgi:hypothetical protein